MDSHKPTRHVLLTEPRWLYPPHGWTGARIGRYIIASTTAKYNEPENVFSVPCDLVFPCAQHNMIDGPTATTLADMGCQGTCLETLPPDLPTYAHAGRCEALACPPFVPPAWKVV